MSSEATIRLRADQLLRLVECITSAVEPDNPLQEWSQQLPQHQFQANEDLFSSGPAEPIGAVADCGDLSYLFTDYDFNTGTDSFGTSDTIFGDTSFLDNTSMPSSVHQPLQQHFGADTASRWPSVNDGIHPSAPTSGSSSTGDQDGLRFRNEYAATTFPDQHLGSLSFPGEPSAPQSTATSTTVSPLQTTIDSYGSSTRSSPKKRPSTSPSSCSPPEDESNKRQRNTEAARRYRQRKMDRVSELEDALAAMTKANDDLKLKLARSEAEADVLRSLMSKRS